MEWKHFKGFGPEAKEERASDRKRLLKVGQVFSSRCSSKITTFLAGHFDLEKILLTIDSLVKIGRSVS